MTVQRIVAHVQDTWKDRAFKLHMAFYVSLGAMMVYAGLNPL